MSESKNQAFTGIFKVMQTDAMEVMDRIDMAAVDMAEGRRNGAIGALSGVDEMLERLAAMVTAVRAMNRVMPQ
ncbi:hypothetical protein [Rhizobium sp. RU36D]|uniref:hypothetical protein n=1 Tax=Rhizobium sp. RU36D TaxID=1907415 RepID=UPI0009D7FCC0|nr:hypothetical protein [Rhizobium sp. RU36D]SMD02779.1 hypothetical protein SAMN05880593_11640 [Rhizobium sp. RU36D]